MPAATPTSARRGHSGCQAALTASGVTASRSSKRCSQPNAAKCSGRFQNTACSCASCVATAR